MVDKIEILKDFQDYLEHLKETGVDKVIASSEALDGMRGAQASEESQAMPITDSKSASRSEKLANVAAEIAECRDCPLCETRTKTVAGMGSLDPDIMFIGEGPGRDEDLQGLPFVGRSGEILDRLIKRMGYSREELFIGNVVKCRATVDYEMQRDRPPTPEEMQACIHYLVEQIAIIRPKVIVTLGNTALEGLFGLKGITKLRGKWLEYEGIPTMPTYHPSFLLRGGGDQGKRFWDVWKDMMAVFEKLGKSPPDDKG